jgi:hypothetical protein
LTAMLQGFQDIYKEAGIAGDARYLDPQEVGP